MNNLGGSIALESYDVEQFAADRAMNAAGTSNAVNVSETGILVSIGIYRSVAWAGSPTMFLEIQIDGGTTRQIQICAGAANFPDTIPFGVFDGIGFTSLQYLIVTRFQSSLRVGLNVTVGGSGGTSRIVVIKGKKL